MSQLADSARAGADLAPFAFDVTAVFTGLVFALVMAELLRIGPVAVMVALLLAGGLVWTLFEGGGHGVTRLVETTVGHLETSAATGFLTGAFLGKSLSNLLSGLRRAATPKPPPRRPAPAPPKESRTARTAEATGASTEATSSGRSSSRRDATRRSGGGSQPSPSRGRGSDVR